MQVLKVILIVLEVLLLFNLLIVVHELGHYLAARWRGLKIERFGIWFGKSIWQKEIDGVVFCLGCIPAGGYVALPQMAPMEAIEGKNAAPLEDLPPITALDKIIVAFAGPLFSFGLALVFAVIVWGIGRPVSERETTTTVGYVLKGSPAEKVGILPGDRILEVDGEPVRRFTGIADDSITWRVIRSEGDTIPVKLMRGNEAMTVNPVPSKDPTRGWQRKSLRHIGVEPAFTPMIGRVIVGGPAARAGLKPNDLIEEVNGRKINHFAAFSAAIKEGGMASLTVRGSRAGKPFEATLKPEIPQGEQEPRVGIVWDDMGRMALTYPRPIEQVQAAVNSMVSTIGALFSPKSDIKPQHLSGPVGILRIYYVLFQSDQGWRMAIWFSVLLNVNLAILNMLPIPVLDGGHILLALVEAVRRKPISVRLLNWIQTACAMLVIGYILYVSFYDVQDLRPGRQEATPEMKFTPPDEVGR